MATHIMGRAFLLSFITLHFFAADAHTVVAVIDTGADINHQDLKQTIWTNPGESGLEANGRDRSTNGIDDDGNGYIDDVHGWNFVDGNANVLDNDGHGTHVAGIIRNEFNAQNNSSTDLKMMILKYYNAKSKNSENIINTVKAIQYARKMQAHVVNYSAGGPEPDPLELQEIIKAKNQGIVFVVAAGNEQNNTDFKGYYPASYKLDNIVSVAALQKNGDLTSFSNYGQNTVDIAAPGQSIMSTLPHNSYGVLSGTSQATAYVSGYLASIISQNKPKRMIQSEVGGSTQYTDYIDKLYKKAIYNKNLKGLTKYQVALQ